MIMPCLAVCAANHLKINDNYRSALVNQQKTKLWCPRRLSIFGRKRNLNNLLSESSSPAEREQEVGGMRLFSTNLNLEANASRTRTAAEFAFLCFKKSKGVLIH